MQYNMVFDDRIGLQQDLLKKNNTIKILYLFRVFNEHVARRAAAELLL